MWERFVNAGSSLCGGIIYFILLSVLVCNIGTKHWTLFDSDMMLPSFALLALALLPWFILIFGSKGFDEDEVESGGWGVLFAVYFYPGLIPFCLGGILIVALPVIAILAPVAILMGMSSD